MTKRLNGEIDLRIENNDQSEEVICDEKDENEIKSSFHWLDKKFVQKILSNDLNSDQLVIDHLDVERAVPKGDNYASLMVRVFIEYRQNQRDQDTKKKSLIIKGLPSGVIQNWVTDIKAFVKEARMFEETLPAMYKLAKERTGEEMEPLATRVYHNDRPDTIVLEDLRPRGYRMASRREGLDLKHSVLALRTLAKFHGLSVALHVEDPTAFDMYTFGMWSAEAKHAMDGFMGTIFPSVTRIVGTWPGFERFEEKMRNVSENGLARVNELMKNRAGSVRVLNHGDFWVNNMMFLYDKDGDVEDVKLVDLQMVFFGSPALDIIYFFYTSPNTEVLENHQEDLLEQYHDALCDTMRRMGCKQELFISLDQLHQEMEDKAYLAVLVSCMSCIMLVEKEDAPEFSGITDKDGKMGEVDVMDKAVGNKRFRKKFQRRLLKFESQGLI